MSSISPTLAALAALTSLTCTVLLFRAYAANGPRLLLWSALCFVGLTANNLLLFVDLAILPHLDLRLYRLSAALAAVLCLLYAFVWEAE